MKGKYAVRAANRSAVDAAAEIARLNAELAIERRAHHDDVEALKVAVRDLRGTAIQRAQAIADEAIAARKAELEQALADEGMSREMFYANQHRMDRFTFNACRYLSMTRGISALNALTEVWTWLSDEDCYGLPTLPEKRRRVILTAIGLPHDGWTAIQLARIGDLGRVTRKTRATRRQLDQPEAVTLDRAEREGHEDIHPNWRKVRKHYDNVQFTGGIVLLEDDGSETAVR